MKNIFTFKTERRTGPYRSFFPNTYRIKYHKKQVGNITDSEPHKIRLMVIKKDIMEDGNSNCEWKWITLKKDFTSVDEAKIFLNLNIDAILNKYELYETEA